MSDKVWCKLFFVLWFYVGDLECLAMNKNKVLINDKLMWKCDLFDIFINISCLLRKMWSEFTLGLLTTAEFLLRWSSLWAPWSNKLIQSTFDCMWMNMSHGNNMRIIQKSLVKSFKGEWRVGVLTEKGKKSVLGYSASRTPPRLNVFTLR